MPMKNTYPLNKNKKACYICDKSSFSSHLGRGQYNVVWTGPYNVIVPLMYLSQNSDLHVMPF